MKRTLPFQLLFAIGVAALLSTAAHAGMRCSDEPEPCQKSAAKVSRPATRLASTTSPAPLQTAPAVTAKKSTPAPAVKKSAAKPKNNGATRSASPTPGMGVLRQLSTGSGGDISWVPGPGKTNETSGQSWVL